MRAKIYGEFMGNKRIIPPEAAAVRKRKAADLAAVLDILPVIDPGRTVDELRKIGLYREVEL